LKRLLFYCLIYISSFLISFTTKAQETKLLGRVKDTMNLSLENTNILAIPLSQEAKIKFSITDANGNYQLKLQKDQPYRIEISYLGYQKITDTIQLSQETIRNYTLIPSSQSLEEIILTERIPVKVREDTITYRVDKFTDGSERKLRDVLKKLPGIEIDRDGNATVNGTAVTKLLVDGKEFFTGDEKLGVNNIPADVIDEVEALDNYNEVSFLKGLSDSEQLALNIKLKDGKKKFAFGDLEVGGGIEERYLVHPTLFYYSPKTSVNVIGDFNNTGQKQFTVQDYLNFEGGFSRFGDDPSAYFNLFRDDFARFLQQRDFVFNRNNFGAFSLSQELTKSIRLDAYSIVSANTLETRLENDLIYLTGTSPDENRLTTQDNDLVFSINKLQLRHSGANNLDIKYEAFLKTNDADGITNLNSQTAIDTTIVNTLTQPESIDFTQKLAINKQFSRKHTTSFTTSYKWADNENTRNYLFNQAVFSNQIPFIDQGTGFFNLDQNTENRINDLRVNLKHYWVLHRFHHVYPEAGVNILNQQYYTRDRQVLDNGENSFFDNGFNNDATFDLVESYAGLTYKAKAGKFIFKPALFYHYYDWALSQFNTEVRDSGKPVLLPRVDIDWEIKSSENLRFRYQFTSSFAEVSQLANRLQLTSFNRLFKGNENLENQLTQRVSLNYNKFSLFKGIFFNAGASYTNRPATIRNSTEIEGIDQINTLILSRLPENIYNLNAVLTKQLNKYRLTIAGNSSFSDYSRIINEESQDFNSNNYTYSLSAKTAYNKGPNFELAIRQSFNSFNGSATNQNRFTQIDPYINVDYTFWNDFTFTADYTFTYYENRGQNEINRFQTANASLFYNKESSPWSFELSATNVFNIDFRNLNSINQFLISDTRTFLQPRILLFKVGYKF